MTSQGSAYTRFQRALATRNLLLIRTAAAELSHVELRDALAIALLLTAREPHRFSRAGARRAARLTLETRGVELGSAGEVLRALRLVADGHAREGQRALATVLDDIDRSELADRLTPRRS